MKKCEHSSILMVSKSPKKKYLRPNSTDSILSGLDERLPMTTGTLTVTVALESRGGSPITLTTSQGGAFPLDMTPAILMQVAGSAIATWVAIYNHTLSTYDENTETTSSRLSTEKNTKSQNIFPTKRKLKVTKKN